MKIDCTKQFLRAAALLAVIIYGGNILAQAQSCSATWTGNGCSVHVQPKLASVAAQASVPSASSYAVSSAPVASVELGTIRGVTIVDNGGALERKGPPPPPESLGDVARRLRQSKQK